MSKSGISLRRGRATLNTEQRESEHDARFPRHPKCHLSTVPAQPHPAMALLQHTALLQPKHSHRTIAFTQNMQAFSVFASIRSRTLHHWPQRHNCTQRSSPGHGADRNQCTNHPHPLRGHQPAIEDTAAGAPPRSLKFLIEPMRW